MIENPLDQLSLADLRRRTSVKWRAYPEDVLPLFVAEMDVPQAPFLVTAVQRALELGDTGYDHGTGYAAALAPFAARRWGWTPDVGTSRTLPDVMVAVVEVLRVLTGPGDAVVVTPPVYQPFYAYTRNEGRQVVEAPLDAAGRLDLGTLEAAFKVATGISGHGRGPGSGRRAVLLLCSPHNPTGTVHTRAELEAVLALADRYGVRVVADEIHAPFTFADLADGAIPFTPLLSVAGSEGAIAVHSASKAFNLAGLRAATAVGGPGAAGDLRRMPEIAGHAVNHLAVIAHAAAYTEGDEWLDALRAGIVRNRELVTGLLAEHAPAVRVHPADGTYLMWLDVRGAVPEGADPHHHVLRTARLALGDGRQFGTGGEGRLRLNLAASAETLTEAVSRLTKALPPR
ncbi:aminotransferase class I/II-fold pyridoxal phosphate-dependent enzyme [Isoptericola sp. S6320L]|uniref:MalY/PatB family protein n=1 Tax=Isoptericola sp. S6320L TaxID=2926411 RepID=UPI001FF1DA6A|nr:aminotransferase class I/II-fold pyridoxal phosphate-dependent enzyme [Isoptericola sp. S6320L]MCK0117302.1 aminotransferase class I/II-fold pyridoxal phosphate-dependent enzyme [Isoptericola sp. S6320L]